MTQEPPHRAEIEFQFAVTADLQQLESTLFSLAGLRTPLILYMHVRRDYLAGDTDSLGRLIEEFREQPSFPFWLIALAELRFCIRKKIAHHDEPALLSKLEKLEQASTGIIAEKQWAAEAAMVLGMYFEEQKRYSLATQYYLQSAQKFSAIDMAEKSLTAEFNALISQTLVNPERRYLVAHHSFIVRARALGHTALVAVALANFAREYQLLGLPEQAFAKTCEALELMRDSDFGTLHYYLTVAQALDLAIILKRFERAKFLHEELRSSPYQEVSEIIKVINLFSLSDQSASEPKSQNTLMAAPTAEILPRPWLERVQQKNASTEVSPMTELEMQILDALAVQAVSLGDLASAIYGDRIEYDSAVARTKQAVYRLRKKNPHLIILRKGRYELAE